MISDKVIIISFMLSMLGVVIVSTAFLPGWLPLTGLLGIPIILMIINIYKS